MSPLDRFTYILDDERRLVNVKNDHAWFMWFGDIERRRVGRDEIGGVIVSTIFGGIDRSYGQAPQPMVFETHVFGGEHDGWEEWSASWAEAELVHAEGCAIVRGELVEGSV